MQQNLHSANTANAAADSDASVHNLLAQRTLIIASNRGPVTLRQNENGELEYQRGSGGLVTALSGLLQHADAQWIACAQTEEEKAWGQGPVPLGASDEQVWMRFVSPSDFAYEGYYRVI